MAYRRDRGVTGVELTEAGLNEKERESERSGSICVLFLPYIRTRNTTCIFFPGHPNPLPFLLNLKRHRGVLVRHEQPPHRVDDDPVLGLAALGVDEPACACGEVKMYEMILIN